MSNLFSSIITNELPKKPIYLNNIGFVYTSLDEFEEAINNYQQAIDLFNQLGQKQSVDFIQENIDKLKEKYIE